MTSWADADVLLRDSGLLVLAWVLGGLIGWQREAQGRAAGLRTHVLVCLGACLIARVSFGGMGDPGRIAAQVVTGIGFLCAGVIFRKGVSVRGLTTAATIWVVAGIGLAVGAGGSFAALAVVAALLVLFTLTAAKRLEDAIGKNDKPVLTITVPRRTGAVGRLMETLTESGARVLDFEASETGDEDEMRTLRLALRLRQDLTTGALSAALTEQLPQARFLWNEETDE